MARERFRFATIAPLLLLAATAVLAGCIGGGGTAISTAGQIVLDSASKITPQQAVTGLCAAAKLAGDGLALSGKIEGQAKPGTGTTAEATGAQIRDIATNACAQAGQLVDAFAGPQPAVPPAAQVQVAITPAK